MDDYRRNTSSMVVTDTPKLAMFSSSLPCSSWVKRSSNDCLLSCGRMNDNSALMLLSSWASGTHDCTRSLMAAVSQSAPFTITMWYPAPVVCHWLKMMLIQKWLDNNQRCLIVRLSILFQKDYNFLLVPCVWSFTFPGIGAA